MYNLAPLETKLLLKNKIINNIMLQGKKSIANKLFYQTLCIIKKDLNQDPLNIVWLAVYNIKPTIELKSKLVAGIKYKIPVVLDDKRSLRIAIKWLIKFARKRKGYSFSEKLAYEILDASKKSGLAIKHKEELNKMALANRPYLKYLG